MHILHIKTLDIYTKYGIFEKEAGLEAVKLCWVFSEGHS